MQRRLLNLATVGILLQATPFTGAHADGTLCQVSVPNLECGFEFNASALFLRPSNRDLDYAILTHPLPLLSPNWNVRAVRPINKIGFDVGVGYVIPNSGNDLQLSWQNLDASKSASVRAIDGPTEFTGPLYQIGPNSVPVRESSGRAKFDYNVINLDAGQFVNFGNCTQARFFVGLNGAQLKQTLSANFKGIQAPGLFSLTSKNISKYDGVGPRLGVKAKVEMCEGFGLMGQMAGSLLIGTMKPITKISGSSPDLANAGISVNHQAISTQSSTQVVPGVDAKLGINYFTSFNCDALFTIEAGYQLATYINAITAYNPTTLVTTPPGPIQTGSIFVNTLGKTVSNFSVSGPYLNFKVKM